MGNMALKWKLVLLVGVSLILSGGSGVAIQYWTHQKVERMMAETEADLKILNSLKLIQGSFGLSIQDWKNTLLRGADPEAYKKHAAAFDEAVGATLAEANNLKTLVDPEKQKLVDQFIEAQTALKKSYVEARSQFINKDVFDPAKADKAVKGKDRNVSDSLKTLSSMVNTEFDLHQKDGRAMLKMIPIIGSVVTLSITALMLGIAVWFSMSLSRNLRMITSQIAASSAQVQQVSEVLSTASQQCAAGGAESAASFEETVASLEELSSMVKFNAEHAKSAHSLSHESKETAEKGGQEMRELAQSISKIVESSKKIEDIIDIIDDIAFQTNLLALNAAVEAARAGEQGKGFAVVAEAVRSLALRSSEAAKDISKLIKESVDLVQSGNKKTDASGQLLQLILDSVKKVSDLNQEISNSTTEQSNGLQQISLAMTTLDSATQQNAASIEHVAASAEEMSQQGRALRALVDQLSWVVEGRADSRAGASVSDINLKQNSKTSKNTSAA